MKKFFKSILSLSFVILMAAGIFTGCADDTQNTPQNQPQKINATECFTKLETLSGKQAAQASPDNYCFTSSVSANDRGEINKQKSTTRKTGTADNYTIHSIITDETLASPVIIQNDYISKIDTQWTLINDIDKTYFVINSTLFDKILSSVDFYKTGIPTLLDMFVPVLKTELVSNESLFNTTVLDGVYTLSFDSVIQMDDTSVSFKAEIKFSETNFYKISFATDSPKDLVSMAFDAEIAYGIQDIVLPNIETYTEKDIILPNIETYTKINSII